MTLTHDSRPLEAESVEAAAALLHTRGLRVSAARRLVLEALFAADGPISVEQVVAGVGGRLPRSDPGSVYRNLETLERLGLVRHFHLGHGPSLYALATAAEREYLFCESCGATRALEPAELDGARELIREELGFHARFTHFPIVGLCSRCAHSEPAAEDATNRTEEDP